MSLIKACLGHNFMLFYTEACLSPYEVPDNHSICIYISGCINKCLDCHYPLLQCSDYGDLLSHNFKKIIALFRSYATCVCFLGEGKNTEEEHKEFEAMVAYSRQQGLKTCLYCGRDTTIESWMGIFDYVKVGSFQATLGGLDSSTTKRMFEKTIDGYLDVTYKFRI